MLDRRQFRMNIRSGSLRHFVTALGRSVPIAHHADHVIKRIFARGRDSRLSRCGRLIRSAFPSPGTGSFTASHLISFDCFSKEFDLRRPLTDRLQVDPIFAQLAKQSAAHPLGWRC
jgi:hypothetical protein